MAARFCVEKKKESLAALLLDVSGRYFSIGKKFDFVTGIIVIVTLLFSLQQFLKLHKDYKD